MWKYSVKRKEMVWKYLGGKWQRMKTQLQHQLFEAEGDIQHLVVCAVVGNPLSWEACDEHGIFENNVPFV